jgi:hypothetical protein
MYELFKKFKKFFFYVFESIDSSISETFSSAQYINLFLYIYANKTKIFLNSVFCLTFRNKSSNKKSYDSDVKHIEIRRFYVVSKV